MINPGVFTISNESGTQWVPMGATATRTSTGARVEPTQGILDGTGFGLETWGGSQGYPAVAFSGGGFVVAWIDVTTGWIIGTRVTPAGAVLDDGGPITGNVNTQGPPALDGAGGGTFGTIYAKTVTSGGPQPRALPDDDVVIAFRTLTVSRSRGLGAPG